MARASLCSASSPSGRASAIGTSAANMPTVARSEIHLKPMRSGAKYGAARDRLNECRFGADDVRALAAAAGLDLPEERVEPVRVMLELVLGETAELDALPLDDVEPLLDV